MLGEFLANILGIEVMYIAYHTRLPSKTLEVPSRIIWKNLGELKDPKLHDERASRIPSTREFLRIPSLML